MSTAPPFASAILLSYNCADQIVAAVRSVLDQQCGPMEVIVSDDDSQDTTFTVLQREVDAYQGPHRITLRRRETNSGSKSAHLNDVFPLAKGQVIVFFDGDDVAEPDRVRRILEVFRADPRVSAVFSDYAYMDREGRAGRRRRVDHPPPGADARHWFAKVDSYAPGATLAVRHDVVETFGPLDPSINEDVVLPFRASLLGDVRYIDEALVRVRRWEGSLTSDPERLRSVENLRSWLLRGVAQARRQMESRLADLDKAEGLGLIQVQDLDAVRAAVAASMADAEDSACLASPSLLVRLRCLGRLTRPRDDWRGFAQNAFLTLAPALYLKYKQRKR
ncbi:glycosyltransferase family A protein [Thioalkalivibrio sp.]|uniref:glycosyltransferase family A protein n=1 Tax=Thioalkalivibrio sp. TaxID=2093813 RepID=UPI0035626E39